MSEKLDVKPGDKVGIHWPTYSGGDGKILDITTVIKITKTGIIIAGKGDGDRKQYDKSGWGKGRVRGKIRKLNEGEEEVFLAERQAEQLEKQKEIEEKDRQHNEQLEIAHKWVLNNAWLTNSIVCVNCTVYIVSLPIPNNPTTLGMIFERSSYGDGYKAAIWILETRGEYFSHGTTTLDTDTIDPLMVAAGWVKYHSYYLITEKEIENAG